MDLENVDSVVIETPNKDEYFESYQDLEVHQIMLNDSPRNTAYKNAILFNKDSIKDKTVLDVGAGTGILSIFCAMAGAMKVYAVEASNLAKIAEEIVKENHFENIITVVHSKIEDFHLDEKVDVIVSEWMGFYLLHEGMLDSVIDARDRLLKSNGLMFPQTATIYAAPCEIPSLFEHWDNVHGVKMKKLAPHIRKSKGLKPEIMQVDEDNLIAEKTAVCWLDLRDVTHSELESFTMKEILGCKKTGNVQGICIWFECSFPQSTEDCEEVVLCTGPYSPQTHWKQTVIVLPNQQPLEEVGDPVGFELVIKRCEENTRRYNLQLTMLDPAIEKHPVPCSCNYTKCTVIRKFYELHPQTNGNTVDDEEDSDEEKE